MIQSRVVGGRLSPLNSGEQPFHVVFSHADDGCTDDGGPENVNQAASVEVLEDGKHTIVWSYLRRLRRPRIAFR